MGNGGDYIVGVKLLHCSLAGALIGILVGWLEVVLLTMGDPFQSNPHFAWNILLVWLGCGAFGGGLAAIIPSRNTESIGAAGGLGLIAFAWATGSGTNLPLALITSVLSATLVIALTAGPLSPWIRGFFRPFPAVLSCVLLGTPAGFLLALQAISPPTLWGSQTAEQTPNVMLIVLDAVPATSLQAYGHYRATSPRIDILAEEGSLFERTWTTSLNSSQALQNLLQVQSGAKPSLPSELKNQGFATGAFIKEKSLLKDSSGISVINVLDQLAPIELSKAVLAFRSFWPKPPPTARPNHGTIAIVNSCLRWLEEDNRNKPFFALLHLPGARYPYTPAEIDKNRFVPEGADGKPVDRETDNWAAMVAGDYAPSLEEVAHSKALHDAAIKSTDTAIGTLIDALREREVLDKTLLVITALHGQEFGQHGYYGHGKNLSENALHVPLIVRHPASIRPKQKTKGITSLANLSEGILHTLQHPGSNSLNKFKAKSPIVAYSSSGDIAVSDGQDKLVIFKDGTQAFINFRLDPKESALEMHQIKPEHIGKAKILESQLKALRQSD